MKPISPEEYNYLQNIVSSRQDFSKRILAHIPILYSKNISTRLIGNIYDLHEYNVLVYLRYFELLGLDGYFDHDVQTLRKLIEDEEYRREKKLLSLKDKPGIFYYLFLPFKWLFSFFGHISTMLTVFLAYIVSLFESKRMEGKVTKNNIRIEKGASQNFILQVGTLNIENDKIEKEHLVTNSRKELIEKVEDLIKSNEEYDLGNKRANSLFDAAQRINSHPDISISEKRSRINSYAVFIVVILLYSTTFKGGVSTISLFGGVIIAVSVRSCSLFGTEVPITTLDPPDLIPDSLAAQIDTLPSKIETSPSSDVLDPIYTVEKYKEKASDWYELDSKCFALSAMGEKQQNFINQYDFVDHTREDYLISVPDNMYYFHVVSYSDIRQAAFQMNFLNDKTDFTAQILKSNIGSETLYAVVIGKFRGDEISKTCQLVDSWAIECITGENDAGYLYNGL